MGLCSQLVCSMVHTRSARPILLPIWLRNCPGNSMTEDSLVALGLTSGNRPSSNIPKAILAQMSIGFIASFCYLIAILYSITDLESVLSGTSILPLAGIYYQAIGTPAGAFGLLLLIFLSTACALVGLFITTGRTLWTLARDRATPFPGILSTVSSRHRNPFNATMACGLVVSCMGAIFVGSATGEDQLCI